MTKKVLGILTLGVLVLMPTLGMANEVVVYNPEGVIVETYIPSKLR